MRGEWLNGLVVAAEQRGLHLSRELRLYLGQHAGRQRVRCRQQMPVAIHQQQLIMPLLGEGLESGAHRRQRPGRFPLRRRNVHPPLKAFRHPLRILLQLADLPLTVNLSGRQIHAPTERQDRQPREQRDDKAPFSR